MCRRQLPIRAPDRCVSRFVELFQRLPQYTAPLQLSAVNGATKGIQNEKLEPLTNRGGNLVVAQLRNEFGDPACVEILAGLRLSHRRARGPTIFARRCARRGYPTTDRRQA